MPAKTNTAPKSTSSPVRGRRPRNRPGAGSDAGRAGGPCLVVGYDGSPEARHAATWAARRAAPDGKLVLIHSSRPRRRWLPVAILATPFERRDRGRALIDELMMDADDVLLEVDVEAHVVDDTPANALIEAARRHGAREIIVGSHHRSRTDAIYGDVASELVRTAPVPVCVVPVGEEPVGLEPGA
ncbi:MAG TPA: universal stress protein [Solirubrobacteraceae bacterium]|nr:universal stress protein [Solirubrobacteraceae bacterium]